MNTLLVTSTAEGTGKTAIAIALARIARERGASVGYMKPKGTRLRSVAGETRDEDPLVATELLDLEADLDRLEPVVYSPTFVAEAIRGRERPADVRERVREAFESLASSVDLMIVEGGGEVWTGGVVDLTDADVAELLDARVLLVSGYAGARDLDAVLAAARPFGDRLAGVLFNAVPAGSIDELADDVARFLAGRDVPTAGVLPRDPELAGMRVADLADALGAETLVAGESGVRVQRFAVGAMGSETALKQFRRLRDAAVLAGGDRADVQTAAIESPGVTCLVLTGGYRPAETVLGAAQDRDVPVLLVRSDTRSTVGRVEDLLETGRTRTSEAVDRMGDLLREGVDLDGVLDLDAA